MTNFHVIAGADSAAVERVEWPAVLSARLVWFSESLDIAILRVDHAGLRLTPAPRSIAFREQPPVEGTAIWALGYPKDVGFSMSRGIVSGVKSGAMLPAVKEAGLSPVATWIQTDCALNPGNSGGPLIDEEGHVVGVTTWTRANSVGLGFALSCTDARDCARHASDAPIGFDALPAKATRIRLPGAGNAGVIDLPSYEVNASIHPSELQRETNSFRRVMHCKACQGTGAVEKEVRVGTRVEGMFKYPIMKKVAEPCTRCKATGLPDSAMLQRATDEWLVSLSKFDHRADGAARLVQLCDEVGAEFLGAGADKVGRFVNVLARKRLGDDATTEGTPVLVVGRLLADYRIKGLASRVRVVQVEGFPGIIVIQDLKVYSPKRSTVVLAGGLLAGFCDDADGGTIAVLQHGLLIGTDQ